MLFRKEVWFLFGFLFLIVLVSTFVAREMIGGRIASIDFPEFSIPNPVDLIKISPLFPKGVVYQGFAFVIIAFILVVIIALSVTVVSRLGKKV